VSSPDRQGALAALGEGRTTLSHLDRARSGEDLAADIIDLWNVTEKSLRALVGVATMSGQQLIRAARQAEAVSLDQAHALLEFLAARDRVNRTTYNPTPSDTAAAREGFKAMESAASGTPPLVTTGPASPYAPPSSYSPGAAAVTGGAASAGARASAPAYAPPPAESADHSTAPSGSRWNRTPLWARIGLPVLLLLLIAGGYFIFARPSSAESHVTAGIDDMQRGQREAARSEFSTAAREDDRIAAPHIFLARLAREDGDLESARRELDNALRLEPRNHVALREMGLVMFASRNYDVARRFFVRAVDADTTDHAAVGYLGCTLSRLNRTEEATRFLNRAGYGAWSACAQPVVATPPPL